MTPSSGFLNDGSEQAPRLSVYLKLDNLVDLRPDERLLFPVQPEKMKMTPTTMRPSPESPGITRLFGHGAVLGVAQPLVDSSTWANWCR